MSLIEKLALGMLVLSSTTLVACSNLDKKTDPQNNYAETTTVEWKPLKIGESVTLDGSYNPNDKGLKITLHEAKIDESIQLNQDYTSVNYDGFTPVVVKGTLENTGQSHIDLTAFEIIDANGSVGKWVPYLEGVSTMLPDGLNPTQKIEFTDVFAIQNKGGFDLNYGGQTWRID